MNNNNIIRASALCGVLLLTACQNYLSRHEGFSPSAGDAIAINETRLVEDPWKESANNKHIHTDGQRASDAVERYKNANSPENSSGKTFGEASNTTQ